MKKISPALVLVKNIRSSQSCGEFPETELEEAAKLILEVEGVINPPILLRTGGLDSYEVIEGHFEYCAALKAKEIDPRKGESINAYIVESDVEEQVFRKQIEVFRTPRPEKPAVEPATMIQLETVRAHLTGLDKAVNQVIEAVQNISGEIKELYRQIEVLSESGQKAEEKVEIESVPQQPEPTEPKLETETKSVETVEEEPVVEEQPIISTKPDSPIKKTKSTKPATKEISKKEQLVLDAVNTLGTLELAVKLKNASANQKIRDNTEKERKKQPFSSLQDMKERVEGLGEKTMKRILNKWS